MTRGTLVQIFSMTKPITGVALMTLYEKGKFQLDDPLARYLPEFAHLRVYAGTTADGGAVYAALQRPVTVRDITRHTAGFYGGMDPGPVAEMYRAADPTGKTNTLKEEAGKLGALPLLFQPGSRWLADRPVDVSLLGVPLGIPVRNAVRQVSGTEDIQAARRENHALRAAAAGSKRHDRHVRLTRGWQPDARAG